MSAATSDKPNVLLLSLAETIPFDEVYRGFLFKLDAVAAIARARAPAPALRRLADKPPQAVLITDGGITEHPDVYATLLDYVRGGGRVVFAGNFSSFVTPDDLDELFRKAGLPWKQEAYHRTTVHRNNIKETSSLPSSYSQKAVFLANVSNSDAWYLPNDESRTESHVFPSERIKNPKSTPIAFAHIEKGKLGYVGDVNGEEESDAVVLAMCGLRGIT